MAKTREKKVVISNVTREMSETAFASYATADARQQQITAKMDGEITRIREKYADELQRLADLKTEAFDTLQVYATENKEVLFSKKKSVESAHGTFGFRMGTPKLKTLKGFTWGAVTEMLKVFLPGYVRVSEEPAKDKLLADRDDEEIMVLLPKIGVFVDQDETFFVEPKKEEVLV